MMSATGQGVSKSRKRSAAFLQQAVDHGYVPAMYTLGVACMSGEGVRRSPEEGFKLFKYVDRAAPSSARRVRSTGLHDSNLCLYCFWCWCWCRVIPAGVPPTVDTSRRRTMSVCAT